MLVRDEPSWWMYDNRAKAFHRMFQSALLGYDAKGEIWGLRGVEETLGIE